MGIEIVEIKFSIILLMYKCELNNLLLTLRSVLEQDFKDYEIVIANDNPQLNFDIEIINMMNKYKFLNYQIINNKENIGTVENLILALNISRGKYFKALGAGDLLFDKMTLSDMYFFLVKYNFQLAFGKMQSYKTDNKGRYRKSIFTTPIFKTEYRKKDWKTVCKRNFFWNDMIWGAALFGEKKFILEYLYLISGNVRIHEDVFQSLVVLDGKEIIFFDRKIIFYEMGNGVSTRKHSMFKAKRSLYAADWINYLELIKKRYKILEIQKHCDRKINVLMQEGSIRRLLRHVINIPMDFLMQCIRNILKKVFIGRVSSGFLSNEEFLN